MISPIYFGELHRFLNENNFKYRGIFTWPIFQGKMLTAGILGPVAPFRYILVTDSLLNSLDMNELKAVLAHEMGHTRFRHMWLYLLILGGFMIFLWFGYDLILFISVRFLTRLPLGDSSCNPRYLQVLMGLCFLSVLYLFLRYVFGYFMRNFERQADLYAAGLVDGRHLISALEKVAYLSGNIRDLPSWHHFSIAQRVEAIRASLKDPSLVKGHLLKLRLSLLGTFMALAMGAALISTQDLDKTSMLTLYERSLQDELERDPDNVKALMGLAQIFLERDVRKAVAIYERVLGLDPQEANALNNLAWILLTSDVPGIRDPKRALSLASRALLIEKNPAYLDTLAEALFQNGDVEGAIRHEEEAARLSSNPKERELFLERLYKYKNSLGSKDPLR